MKMGDEDHRRAARREPADGGVQGARLVRGQPGGWLVHDDQLGVTGQRAEDLDLLLLRDVEVVDARVTGYCDSRVVDQLGEPTTQAGAADERPAVVFDSEVDVLDDLPIRYHA
jgi:hypothetical protein